MFTAAALRRGEQSPPQRETSLLQGERVAARKRQGLVPDFIFRLQWGGVGPEQDILSELKTLHYGSSTDTASEARTEAMKKRARTLPGEYARKACQTDILYCSTRRGEIGPNGDCRLWGQCVAWCLAHGLKLQMMCTSFCLVSRNVGLFATTGPLA